MDLPVTITRVYLFHIGEATRAFRAPQPLSPPRTAGNARPPGFRHHTRLQL